ncbi:MAG: bifunctional N-acetylglucosamine-1-phosphate uridyltransferase/glucosamine-1-phosphate acetyltransferase [bacterium]|nr:bifunctional N-acetylglucosamine-1-phosphate uridyltransferase/glucosamine-1-phosphate acetyltransferase [bacterium]
MGSSTTVVILAAGKGTRMRSTMPKVLHPLCGRPMIAWVIDLARTLDPERIVLVTGYGAEQVAEAARAAAGDHALECVVQEPQHGTGHAMQVAQTVVPEGTERVVVLYGDMPLLCPSSLEALLAAQGEAGAGSTAMLTMRVAEPHGYGRIVRDAAGGVSSIVEEKDASLEQRAIDEINLGVYAFDGAALRADLPNLSNDNAQEEYYITDLVGMAVGAGRTVAPVVLTDRAEARGVNSMAELAEARTTLQMRILEEHMANGVLIEDPATTFVEHGVEIGAGTHILPCTVIHSGVTIGAGCEVGPFTHLRVGTVLADAAEVGNFTECKQSHIGEGSKAKHLSYLGNTNVGKKTNIGAGTIFANYDGKKKHTTDVGDGVFVGSGTIIVAPNRLPDGTTTGAGAVVTRTAKLAPGETWIGLPARRLGPPSPGKND